MLTKNIIFLFEYFFCLNFIIYQIHLNELLSTYLGAFMDTYRLNLSWSELDTLKAAMNITISNLDRYHNMLNEKLDTPLTPELYAQNLEYLSNLSRDKANMLSILLKADLSHE